MTFGYFIRLCFYDGFSVQILIMLDFPLDLLEKGRVNNPIGSGRVGHFPQSVYPCNFFVVLLQNLLNFCLLLLAPPLVVLDALLPLVFAFLLDL